MAALINFESSSAKDEEKRIRREQRRAAQKQYLEKAKSDFEKKERRKDEAKKRGEDTWMLPSLDDRLKEESTKKKKKHKKEKKKKKKHKKDKKESSASESEDEWVEKGAENEPMETDNSLEPDSAQPLKRDDWLMAGDSFVPTFSRDDLRAKIKADKEEKQRELEQNSKDLSLDQPGLHHLELNPYWKDGGTGLPEDDKEKKASSSGVGDGGVGWLKKALKRVEEQAREDGRSLEELAAEKWGSLKTIKKMIADAEAAEQKASNAGRRRSRSRDRRPSSRSPERRRWHSRSPRRRRSRSRDDKRRKRRYSTDSDSDSSDSKSRSRSPRGRSRSRSPRRRRSRSPKRRRSRSRSPKRRSRSRSPRRRRSHSRDRTEIKSRRFMKPGESEDRQRFRKPDMDDSDSKSRFRKPDSDESESKSRFRKPDESETKSRSRNQDSDESDKSRFRKPGSDSIDSRSRDDNSVPRWRKQKEPEPSKSPVKESSSSSSESSEEDEEPEPVKVLTEAEMNALGAKIVKAELMGDDDKAAELKAQLDAARTAAAKAPKPQPAPSSAEPQTVILTKTTKTGVSMPLGAAQHEMWGGRKGKKKKVATHGKSGERERYFADDDKFTLKQMFEREKLGTAEDSNRMFARLAGRGVEKTDDDYQIDDAYLKRATGEQSEARLEEQDRASAISQHKKLTQALDNCKYCLEKTAKHLIIAIGLKSYVSLPASASLTEGHCQIVPIDHAACSTALDEDVWREIQVFRQTLTKMFADQDLDCVFMETALGVQRHPHMVLECVPVPRETGDLAPIYFKKAIQEHGDEWAQNVKLVDISRKDIRHSVPKNFHYFAVDFGTQGGYAHVIEDEQNFSRFFGKEIIGGMLDVEPRLWRKGQRQSFEDQRKKVLQFAEWWKPFDWTVTIKKRD